MSEYIQKDEMSDQLITLPLSTDMQGATLHYALTDKAFGALMVKLVKPDWFMDPRDGKTFSALVSFVREHNRTPSEEELVYWTQKVRHDPKMARKCLDHARELAPQFSPEVLGAELTTWLKARVFRETFLRSQRVWNSGDIKGAFRVLADGHRKITELSNFDSKEFDFSTLLSVLAKADADYSQALTTGLKALDDALLPRDRRGKGTGALLPGRTTVLLAPSTVGKSTTLITIIVANLRAGRSILYLTHEGTPAMLVQKLTCNFFAIDQWSLSQFLKTSEGQAAVNEFSDLLKRQMVFAPDPGSTVEEVASYIEAWQADRVSKTGKGFDLLVDDYPAILTAEEVRGGKEASRREVDETTYRAMVKLARDHGFHALLAVQANRNASKKNRTGDDVVGMDDIAESFGIAMAADNVITLNRRVGDGSHMLFFVAKCREGEAEMCVYARSQFSCGISHSDELGGTYSWRKLSLSEQFDDLIKEHNGHELPAAVAKSLDAEAKTTRKTGDSKGLAPTSPKNGFGAPAFKN